MSAAKMSTRGAANRPAVTAHSPGSPAGTTGGISGGTTVVHTAGATSASPPGASASMAATVQKVVGTGHGLVPSGSPVATQGNSAGPTVTTIKAPSTQQFVHGISSPPVFKIKKRANHNELERKRRNQQKNVMQDLRDAIPILQSDKPSTVLTLTKAHEYISMLENKAKEQEAQLATLRGKAKKHIAAATTEPVDPRSAQKEQLRQENDELRMKIQQLGDYGEDYSAYEGDLADPSLVSAAARVMQLTSASSPLPPK